MAGFLDPEAIAQLESLPVKARIVVEGALTGLHRARLHGSSVEFAQHKEYSPGDDIRHLDWKVFGKADRYYIKQFEQESELTAYLILDASGSMAYSGDSLSKLEYASYLLAALAYLLIKQRDKVGLLVFGDEALERYVPARARPAHLHDLLAVIEGVNQGGAAGAESVSGALDRIAELSRRRRSLIVLASDMFDGGTEALAILKRLRARGHDVSVLHTLHPDELSLPFDGLTLFESLESPRQLLANPGAIRKEYKRRLSAFLSNIAAECTAGGIDYHTAPTSRPLERTLLDFLVARTRGDRLGAEEISWSS
jgi:uncharacterized protein (DUF58 family)